MSAEQTVAVLCARRDSIYKTMPGLDVYDAERDARSYVGPAPIIGHPPCRGWGRLRGLAKPAPGELDLGRWVFDQARQFGGVIEHPAFSTLWTDRNAPRPGRTIPRDSFGGWTLQLPQYWFGHKASKETWLYVVGVEPGAIPAIPLRFGEPEYVVSSSLRGPNARRKELTKSDRERTPPAFAEWLVDLARSAHVG